MKHLPVFLQVVGTTILVVSLSMISVPLGVGFAGVSCLVFGIAAERGV